MTDSQIFIVSVENSSDGDDARIITYIENGVKKSVKAARLIEYQDTEQTKIIFDGYASLKKMGSFIGIGTSIYSDGSRYEGSFFNGRRHGDGTYTYSDGSIYTGQWEKGKIHGQGGYTYPSGSRCKGQWENDKRQGDFLWVDPNGKEYKVIYNQGVKEGSIIPLTTEQQPNNTLTAEQQPNNTPDLTLY